METELGQGPQAVAPQLDGSHKEAGLKIPAPQWPWQLFPEHTQTAFVRGTAPDSSGHEGPDLGESGAFCGFYISSTIKNFF